MSKEGFVVEEETPVGGMKHLTWADRGLRNAVLTSSFLTPVVSAESPASYCSRAKNMPSSGPGVLSHNHTDFLRLTLQDGPASCFLPAPPPCSSTALQLCRETTEMRMGKHCSLLNISPIGLSMCLGNSKLQYTCLRK